MRRGYPKQRPGTRLSRQRAIEFVVDTAVGGAMLAAGIALILGLIVLNCMEL